jgi:tetratricopeptide (TPR) repeat protein
MNLISPQEALPRELAFAEKAVELDDGLAGPQYTLASVLSWGQWEWTEAWEHWRRALAINPNDPMTNAYYAHFLCIMGLPEEGLIYAERALETDPFDALYQALYGFTLVFNGRYEDAISAATTAREIDPNVPIDARQYAYIAAGMLEAQLAHQRERIADDPERVAAFERGLAEGGYEGAQLAIAALLAERYEGRGGGQGHFGARGIALRYLDGWDIERGMYWIKKAVEERDPNLPYLRLPPCDRLASHPDYPELLESLNFPPEVRERYLARADSIGPGRG